MSEQQATPEAQSQPPLTREVAGELVRGLVKPEAPQQLSPAVRGALEAWHNKQAEEVLRIVAGEVIPFGEEDVKRTLVENLGERNPKTGQKIEPQSGPEKERFDQAKETAKQILEYLKNPQGDPPEELLKMAYSYLASSPAIRELIVDDQGKIKEEDAKAIAITLLRQPKVREAMMRLYTERLDPEKRLPYLKEVFRLTQEVERIKAELGGDIDELVKEKREELQNLSYEIESNPRYSAYRKLQDTLLNLQKQKQILEGQLERVKKSRPARGTNQQIEDQIADFNKQINNIEQNIVKAEEELMQFQNDSNNSELLDKINRLNQANQELQALEQKKREIDPKRRRELEGELLQKQAELQEAGALLLAERIKYAGQIQSIVPEALKTYLDEALSSAAGYYREEAVKEARQKEQVLGQAVEKIAERLGRKRERKKGLESFVPHKGKARALLQKFLSPGGVDQLFDETAGELRLNKDHLQTMFGLNEDEADVFIEKCKDPQYRQELAMRLAQGVFADYIYTGGRLSKGIVAGLIGSNWGERLINEGLALVEQRRAELEKLFGKGVINRIDELKRKGFEWMKKSLAWSGLAIGILLILLIMGVKAGTGI